MKKAKLFMMLALLVMGVSNTWGIKYRVLFESKVIDGGYTVNPNQSVVTSADNALVLESSQTLTSNNIRTYITANTVTGNTADFVIDNQPESCQMGCDGGVIYITYNKNVSDDKIYAYDDDENFYYSNIYTSTQGRSGWVQNDNNPNRFPYVKSEIYLGPNKVAISLKNTSLQDVTIPVTDPNGKTVVAIQRFGMTYSADEYYVDLYNCSNWDKNWNDYSGTGTYHDTKDDRSSTYYNNIDYYKQFKSQNFHYDHRNEYLKTVTFAAGSQVASIGDYAFVCCLKLTEVNNIPMTLTNLGQAAFAVCEKVTKIGFPIRSGVKTIRNFTFWSCFGLQRLSLPEGVEEIEGQQGGRLP